ncbi:hypothetical protein IR083_10190 [Dysgonomonas sp. GY75]|uniref:hypothetical protein n=1 Tax=Dysgonomonas sp. GY75 TaxID=2780419 RepID=UPI001883D597|nr:hypothetical protein [Dysgonomonas sp. GY75]MBF0649190.1 hypothetical protein [Dysgonomonas sp. GY75]
MERIITGPEAVERMRRQKLVLGATFGIRFITCDLNRPEKTGQVRVYSSCRIRPARRSEGLSVNSDHYLYFTDEDTDEPRQCFKKLIRAVCFSPSNEWYTVKWFL